MSKQNMSHVTHESINRIKQYCDQSGVTDRYTGYRNNLTRGNDTPRVLDFGWLNPADSPHFTNIRVKGAEADSYNQRLCDRDCKLTASKVYLLESYTTGSSLH